MDRYIGQLSGNFTPGLDLKDLMPAEVKTIVKIGIQLKESQRVFLNGKEFIIGKTGKLEFDNVNINSIKVENERANDQSFIYTVIDYFYTKE